MANRPTGSQVSIPTSGPDAAFGGMYQSTTVYTVTGQIDHYTVPAVWRAPRRSRIGVNAFGTDVQIFVMTPPGAHPGGFPATSWCAHHSSTTDSSGRFVAFTNLPFMLDGGPPCGVGAVQGPLDGLSIYSGHECTETLTDPALNAWYDTDLAGEIGDKYQNAPYFAQTLATGVFAQQQLWSNAIGGCASSS